ncbi:hypothetical protein CTAYLR_003688 [Chrysophaeum taylorii]|uniref:Poly A polymerase head domain-containing protein n=1 Tax=Chrysophaeum taylorii TaxID=2483200 RepID=A0AAD7UN01_9STRA|nr:hypothetical protein CTAYLR_003688 [Chrysophaeum taylorii]
MSSSSSSREVDIASLSLDQLNQLKQQHEQEIQNYTAQHSDMKQLESRFKESRSALEVIATDPNAEGRELLVPLTQSLYVPGKIVDAENVLVDIGTGYYVEKSVAAAKDLLDRRVDLVTKNSDSVTQVVMQKQRNLEAIVMMMQYKLSQIQEKKADLDERTVEETTTIPLLVRRRWQTLGVVLVIGRSFGFEARASGRQVLVRAAVPSAQQQCSEVVVRRQVSRRGVVTERVSSTSNTTARWKRYFGGFEPERTRVMTNTVTSEELPKAMVELTPNEAELVEILVAAAARGGSTVRICGGWVRDKALGKVTKDIDVAVDNCSGATFAERVSSVVTDRHGRADSRIGVIAANPEQSKHLETATMRLCDLEVDLVNLRSEQYADDASRVPTSVDFGTPLEDASRRDFTLNALFFNVHTRKIEDWTGKGWDDLRAGVLRTPLDARVTLLDDPLRALRGVRFAARYGFRLDAAFRDACRDPDVRDALLAKVSRERVGKELKGALAASPTAAPRVVAELRALHLASAALRTPIGLPRGTASGVGNLATPVEDVYARNADDATSPVWHLAARCVSAHAAVAFATFASPEDAVKAYKRDELGGWLAALALVLSPLAGATVATPKHKTTPLPTAVCREGLKLPTREGDVVQALIDASPKCRDLADRWRETAADPRPDALDLLERKRRLRRDVGVLLFDLRDKWRAALAVARARDLASLDDAWAPGPALLQTPAAKDVKDKYADLLAAVDSDFNLDNVWNDLKPFFDGKRLISEFHVPKGPAVGNLLRIQRDFQLLYPAADADACRAYLVSHVDRAVASKKQRT